MTPKSKSKSESKNTFFPTPETNMSPELEVLRCRCCLLKRMFLCKWHKNHSSENQYIPWKSMVGRCISLLRDMSMLVFGVYLRANMLIQKSIYKWSSSKRNKHGIGPSVKNETWFMNWQQKHRIVNSGWDKNRLFIHTLYTYTTYRYR